MIPCMKQSAIAGTLIILLFSVANSEAAWWDDKWQGRAKITVDPSGHKRVDYPAEVSINFTTLLGDIGLSGELDDVNLRVVSVDDQGAVLDANVPFQFDKDKDYEGSSKATGTLVFISEGTLSSGETKDYYVYFDTKSNSAGKTPSTFASQITITEGVDHEGEQSIKIETSTATYYYHIFGAGFASMEDANGNDWISYHPGGAYAGEYRGIPNMNVFAHPGHGTAYGGHNAGTTEILNTGPIKFSLYSQGGRFGTEIKWEFYAGSAKMTLVTTQEDYMWGYEGTPGGTFDASTDFYVNSNGNQQNCNSNLTSDLPNPEWVYFGDASMSRVLFLIQHTGDNHSDRYFNGNSQMTVFGFGRAVSSPYGQISTLPANYTIGFTEITDFNDAKEKINGVYLPISVTLGSAEKEGTTGILLNRKLESNKTFWVLPNRHQPGVRFNFMSTFIGPSELVSIHDVRGRLIKRLCVSDKGNEIAWHCNWNGTDLYGNPVISGVYLAKPMPSDIKVAKRFLLVK